MGTVTVEKKAPETKSAPKPTRARQDDKFKVFSGTSNPDLAREVCDHLGIPLGQADLLRSRDFR